MNHSYYKYILFVIAAFFVVIPAYAYDPNNFLNEYCAEGYDMTFNDQHENIFCILVGIVLFLIARHPFRNTETNRMVKISGGAIVTFGLLNMVLGVPFDKYEILYQSILIVVCLILTLVFKKKFGSGRIFISVLIYIATIMCSFLVDRVDYVICDKLNQYPPEYGLQWRPFYQGFTDNAYFGSLEKKVKSDDSSKTLYNLLTEEPHSFHYPFNYLKQQGWEIIKSEYSSRLFINPDKKIGYIQILQGGGLVPPQSVVNGFKDCFPLSSMENITGFHELVDSDDIIVLTTEVNDTTKLYIKNLEYDRMIYFVNLKDSILSLPDSEITNIIPPDGEMYSLNEDFYEISKVLSFPKDTIRQIEYEGQIIRVRFKDPNAKDKVYTNNSMVFVDINYETGTEKLHRF